MEEKIMHLLITEDDMALAQGLQRALQKALSEAFKKTAGGSVH